MKKLAAQIRQDEERRYMADMYALANGGIPIKAQERLSNQARENADFSCNLSPNELSLLRRLEHEPIATVSGSALFHVGFFYGSASSDCEISEISNAFDDATMLAVERLRQELLLVGAHGVVGVRMRLLRPDWAERSVEVQLIGTGVRSDRAPAEPWLCTMPVQDWFALKRAGYEPVGICWGFSSWFMLTTVADEIQLRSFQNCEMTHWSDSLRQARNVAMRNLFHWYKKLPSARGIVGISCQRVLREVRDITLYDSSYGNELLDEEVRKREHHILELSLIGTAIRPRSQEPHYGQPTKHVISLRDGRLKRIALSQADPSFSESIGKLLADAKRPEEF